MEGKQAREQTGEMRKGLTAMWNEDRSLPAPAEHVQENVWVTSSQHGDALAFNRLVLKWERTVYNVALRMLQDRDEAAEATQEVFLSAFKNIRRFRRDSMFSTWLYRIAVNHCISRARRRPPGTHFSLDDATQNARSADQLRVTDTQEGKLLCAENRSRVRAALAFLPPDQQAVIELKFFQELTFEDIAAVLQVPLSTIKSRLYAGLEILKVRLGART
jgi:RNA polymerase sigma-70 factor (ECF subfamily)